jgi:two-component system, NtrC family, response regulator AtoC
MVGHSASLHQVFDTARRVAAFNSTVLINGESGTGKELLARGIHELSPRAKKPFIAVNCGAIPESLMESEFFGHKKGAFTDAYNDRNGLFDEADGGTIFLDEIGEMPLHLQVKLLRVLQEQQIQRIGEDRPRPISVRVIAATLRNLAEDVKNGRFREDLFYRLNVINLTLPPLRERPEDLPYLVQHFIDKYNVKLGTRVKGVSPAALQKLAEYSWPGNVRELENCIERAIVLTEAEELGLESLPQSILTKAIEPDKQSGHHEPETLSIPQETERLERRLIEKALTITKGNRSQASEILGISLRSLMYKIKIYNLA